MKEREHRRPNLDWDERGAQQICDLKPSVGASGISRGPGPVFEVNNHGATQA